MDPQARVRTALSLGRPDRPPAGWWGHTYREEWSPRDLAAVTVARQRAYGWDFVKLQPRACCFAEAFGSEYRPSGDARTKPVLVRPAVTSPTDWSQLPSVDAGAPALRDQVEAVRMVAGELGPSVPVIQTVFSPLTVAGYLVGEDRPRAARELRERPEAVGSALERIADALGDFAARSVAAGAAGIFYAISGYASRDLLSLEDYERLALPHDRRVLASVPQDAWFTVLHLCGPRLHFEVASALDAHAVSWSVHEPGNPSLAEGRARSGRAVMGGLDQTGTLVRGSPAAVIEEARAAVAGTEGAGLLLASGCSVPPRGPGGEPPGRHPNEGIPGNLTLVCTRDMSTVRMKRVNALELRQSLGKVVEALERTGEPIILEKGRRPVAALISLRDFHERFVEVAAAAERDRVMEEIDALARSSSDPTPAVQILRELRGSL